MKYKKTFLLLSLAFLTLVFTSCILGSEIYTITFDSQGGITAVPENKLVKMKFGISFDDSFNIYGELATTSREGYTFEGWYTSPYGRGKRIKPSTQIENQSNHTLYAYWKINPILSEKGPAEGIIFYDKGEYSDGWRYIEAAPFDQTSYIPWSSSNSYVGQTQAEIGTGKNNTEIINKNHGYYGNSSYGAAELCYELVLNGYSDWYLPSINELEKMNKYSELLGLNGQYWSSTEEGLPYAYFYWVSNYSTVKGVDSKLQNRKVRAIRYF